MFKVPENQDRLPLCAIVKPAMWEDLSRRLWLGGWKDAKDVCGREEKQKIWNQGGQVRPCYVIIGSGTK